MQEGNHHPHFKMHPKANLQLGNRLYVRQCPALLLSQKRLPMVTWGRRYTEGQKTFLPWCTLTGRQEPWGQCYWLGMELQNSISFCRDHPSHIWQSTILASLIHQPCHQATGHIVSWRLPPPSWEDWAGVVFCSNLETELLGIFILANGWEGDQHSGQEHRPGREAVRVKFYLCDSLQTCHQPSGSPSFLTSKKLAYYSHDNDKR